MQCLISIVDCTVCYICTADCIEYVLFVLWIVLSMFYLYCGLY